MSINTTTATTRPALDRLREAVENVREHERREVALVESLDAISADLRGATDPKTVSALLKSRTKAEGELLATRNALDVLRARLLEVKKDTTTLRAEAVEAVEANHREAYDAARVEVAEAVRGLRVALENARVVMEKAARVFDDYNDLGARLPRRPFGRDVGHFKAGHAALRILDALHGAVLAPADIKANDDDAVEVDTTN